MQIAEPSPTHCSACWQTNRDLVHVDFDAHTEGPVFRDEHNQSVPIDNIVICKTCLCEAGKLIDLDDASELLARIEQLQAELADAEKRAAEEASRAEDLERAVTSKEKAIVSRLEQRGEIARVAA